MNSTHEIYREYIKCIESNKLIIINSIVNLESKKEYITNRRKEFKESDFKSNNKLISDLLSSLSSINKEVTNCNTELQKLVIYTISYSLFKIILNTFNFEISKFILEGYQFRLLGTMKGKLLIREIDNIHDTRVDWETSNKLKAKYIEEGKSIYNKETNPTGIKWIVYHIQEFNYWWTWLRPKVSNYFYFTFTPTNGCNTKERKQSKFLESCSSKDDILNTTHLGNKDKLFALLKYDSNQFMKYRNNRTEKTI